jgi:2-dehydropantoate 2-reductase
VRELIVKICVVGAGALGSTIGGTLAASGLDVWLVDRFQAHVDAVNQNGLTLREGEQDRTIAVKARCSADGIGVADLVIVLVKSFHTAEAIRSALSLIGPDTLVMSLQNGLGHEDILAEVIGRSHIIAGKTYVGGVFLAPGHVRGGVIGKETLIGELDGSLTPRIQRVADAFNAAFLLTTVSDNIMGTIWDKLLVNVATGAVCAVTGLPYGPLYAVPEIEATAIAAVAEAMAVARANGALLSMTDPREAWVKAAVGLGAAFKTSMLQSLEKGGVTEVDFINGAVVRWGARCGVATPVNATLVACVKGIERRILGDAA